MAADSELIGALRAALRETAQPELAGSMQVYMKSATPYLGVRVPVMRALTRAEAKLRPFTALADLIDTVLELWRAADYREVDELAHRVGDLLLGWPGEVRPTLVTWSRSDDRWLRRVSIICQLGARDRADLELLTLAIESSIGDSDFFLRKAIGWALRDYARTDPAWVRSFAATHELSPWSRREALKHLA